MDFERFDEVPQGQYLSSAVEQSIDSEVNDQIPRAGTVPKNVQKVSSAESGKAHRCLHEPN